MAGGGEVSIPFPYLWLCLCWVHLGQTHPAPFHAAIRAIQKSGYISVAHPDPARTNPASDVFKKKLAVVARRSELHLRKFVIWLESD
jgi:hypothetical protein